MRWLLPALFLLLALPLAAAAAPVRRFAVLVGNDEGGPGTRPLKYAELDARRVHDALTRLGGVHPGDVRLLLGESAADLDDALGSLEEAIRAAQAGGARPELVLYYSGHAKDGELRLGETGYPLALLKERLSTSQAAIRIAFLDACRSGVITRSKGARRAPAFDVESGPRAATGLVILTSSSNDEDSQESDRITGSFFTHALVSGMLGEADASGDRRVSLAEAYAYAYDRTVAGTLETSAGTQHPTFAFDLAGHGDVILTDLRGPSLSFLVLPAAASGTYVVVDDETRFVAAEVEKVAGQERRVALAPGSYLVKTRLPDRLRIGEVRVPSRGEARLQTAKMRDVDFADDPVKGASLDLASLFRPRAAVAATLGWQTFLTQPVREGYFPAVVLYGMEVELRDYLRPGWILGADLGLGRTSGTVETGGVPFAYDFEAFTVGATVAVELLDGPLRPWVGARLAFVSFERSFDDPLIEAQSLATTAPGAVAGLTWRFTDVLSVHGRVRTSWLLYAADENRSLGYLDAGGGLRLEF